MHAEPVAVHVQLLHVAAGLQSALQRFAVAAAASLLDSVHHVFSYVVVEP
jgi:hypothetical protein